MKTILKDLKTAFKYFMRCMIFMYAVLILGYLLTLPIPEDTQRYVINYLDDLRAKPDNKTGPKYYPKNEPKNTPKNTPENAPKSTPPSSPQVPMERIVPQHVNV